MPLYLHHVDLQGSINEQKKNMENCRNMHFSPKYAQKVGLRFLKVYLDFT
jgi:hypothetical protein